MIYTLEFCPSLEYSGFAESVALGMDNNVSRVTLRAGGSGIIAAQVLAQLEVPVTALGFAAGYSGGEIESTLRKQKIDTDFIYLEEGLSPVNLAVNYGDGESTRFVSSAPRISFEDLTALLDKIARLADGDTLLISGEVPESVPSDIYEHIPDLVGGRNVRIVLDIPAENAVKCLKFAPFLVVLDPKRIGDALGELPQSEEEIYSCIEQFREMGARNVLAPLYGGRGAVLLDENGVRHVCTAEQAAGTTARDIARNALIAGYLAGADDSDVDGDYSLMLAAAASRAACDVNGIPSKPKILEIMKTLLKKFAEQ